MWCASCKQQHTQACYCPDVMCYSPGIMCYSPGVACYSPSITCYCPDVMCYSPGITCYCPSITCCCPSIAVLQPPLAISSIMLLSSAATCCAEGRSWGEQAQQQRMRVARRAGQRSSGGSAGRLSDMTTWCTTQYRTSVPHISTAHQYRTSAPQISTTQQAHPSLVQQSIRSSGKACGEMCCLCRKYLAGQTSMMPPATHSRCSCRANMHDATSYPQQV